MADGSSSLTVQRFKSIENRVTVVEAGLSGSGNVPGEMALFPWRVAELPPGWYHRNGDLYPLTSNEGQVLNGFSSAFKSDWGIVVTGSNINVPSAYHSDGRTFFDRAVNGSTRLPGSVEQDAIRNITGTQGGGLTEFLRSMPPTGVFVKGDVRGSNECFSNASNTSWDRVYNCSFNASLVVPTATENRPLNRGMTPAIFLGVF
ncbi:MAG: hypothetical protein LBT47_00995 [Deltaproteobacteria bacterium]|jgi:hypothetical protein|nr:hypothetical protein [Deltaproteobacteria bacterium]